MNKLLTITTFILFGIQSYAQQFNPIDSVANISQVAEEFELLNFCHCIEYMMIKNHESEKKFLKNNENQLFAGYLSGRIPYPYYDSLYQHSFFFKKGVSAYFEKKLNYSRLDSLYYKPIFDHYMNQTFKIEGKNSKKGMSDHNSYFDCFYRLKEIPLQEELKKFLILNHDMLFNP